MSGRLRVPKVTVCKWDFLKHHWHGVSDVCLQSNELLCLMLNVPQGRAPAAIPFVQIPTMSKPNFEEMEQHRLGANGPNGSHLNKGASLQRWKAVVS